VGRPCTICTHAERAVIEAELEAGQPLRDIAVEYGASKTALHRHLHLAERPLTPPGGPQGHSGTWVPGLLKWGLGVAGIVGVAVWFTQNQLFMLQTSTTTYNG
jgi:hypothetical protein